MNSISSQPDGTVPRDRMNLLALGVLLLILLIYFLGVPQFGGNIDGQVIDGHKYLHLSDGHIGSYHIAPFCWRIGTPLLAWLSPLSNRLDFQIIGFLALWATGFVLFRIGMLLSGDFLVSLSSVAMLYTTGVIFHRSAAWFALVDPMVVLAFSLALWFSLVRSPVAFVLTIALGVFFKESVLAAAPVYFLMNGKNFIDFYKIVPSLLGGLAGILVVLGLRYAIPAMNGNPVYEAKLSADLLLHSGGWEYKLANLVDNFAGVRIRNLWLFPAYWGQTFGVLSFLIVAGVIAKPSALRLLLPLAGILSLQLFFASDTHRLLAVGFPFMVVAVVPAMHRIGQISRLALSLFVVLALTIVLIRTIAIQPLYDYPAIVFLLELNLLLGVLLLVSWYGLGRRARREVPKSGLESAGPD